MLKHKEEAEPLNGTTKRRFVQLYLEDDSDTALLMYHEEPICRDGVHVGSTTSGMWEHRINKSLGMGYVECADGVNKDFLDSGEFEIEIAWKRYKAKAQFAYFYDSQSEKIKA